MSQPKPNSAAAIRRAWDQRVASYACMLADLTGRGLAAEIELAAFRSALPPGRALDVMDAGCGPGFHGLRLLAMGHRVTFADVSPAMLERAALEAGKVPGAEPDFLECDLRDLRLPDASFDAIIAGGTVLSDCGGPRQALGEIARVLRTGGVAGLSVRNLDGPQQESPRRPVIRKGGPGFDWWFFSIESLAEVCCLTGLQVERTCPVFWEPPSPGDLRSRVARHLEAGDSSQWRGDAWEFFAVARRVGR